VFRMKPGRQRQMKCLEDEDCGNIRKYRDCSQRLGTGEGEWATMGAENGEDERVMLFFQKPFGRVSWNMKTLQFRTQPSVSSSKSYSPRPNAVAINSQSTTAASQSRTTPRRPAIHARSPGETRDQTIAIPDDVLIFAIPQQRSGPSLAGGCLLRQVEMLCS